jgi:hypothetical protein
MFRKTFAFGGALLVAAALVFLTAGPSQAAPRGGGHGGGFHTGGIHTGGIHTGGYHAGGYRYGSYRPYYRDHGHYRGYGYYPYYSGYYPYSYGVYPYYNNYSSPYFYGSLPDYSSGLGSGSTGDLGYSSPYYPAFPAQADTTAPVVNVPVPPGTPEQTPMTKTH